MSGGVPRPIAVLGVVLIASVGLGAWLNDSGPWAPPPPFDPHVSAFAFVPSTAEPIPVVVPGDRASLTGAMRVIANSMLGKDTSDGPVANPDGFCAYAVDAKAQTITFAWRGTIPAEVLARQTQARDALAVRVVRRPVAHSAAEVHRAFDDIDGSGSRSLRRASDDGVLASGLRVDRVSEVGRARCQGLRVRVSGPHEHQPTPSQLRDARQVLRGLVPNVPMVLVPVAVARENCVDNDCLATHLAATKRSTAPMYSVRAR